MKKIIIIKYGELSTKKDNINFFLKTLKNNIANLLSDIPCDITYDFGRMFIDSTEDKIEEIVSRLKKVFGIHERAMGTEVGIVPCKSKTGIEVMSVNLLLEDATAPVVWRGPIIAGTVKQFWSEVIWGDVDYMFVDMPPGTGDVPLTVFQSLPLDGIIIVTSPQELVSMIVEKAVNMAGMMNIPILGLVENMSYLKCPDCSKEIQVFGESHVDEIAKKHGLNVLAKLPIDPSIAKNCDKGLVELVEGNWLDEAAKIIENLS